MADNLRMMGLDRTRARKGAVRPKVTGEDLRRMLAEVATGAGVPFVDAASQAQQGNYGQAAVSGLLDAPPVKFAGMALAPLIGMVKQSPVNLPPLSNAQSPVNLPPLSNAQKTQIIGTLPTYQKAADILNQVAPQGKTLDFGAGLGEGAKALKADTFEPYPRTGFNPTFTNSADIPSESYERLTNFNVLNVVPKEVRDSIVKDIGRILKPGGTAIVTTRGRDVLNSSGTAGPEPMSVVTSIGTYQKGFKPAELQEYIGGLLGNGFEVSKVKLGPAGVVIKKKGE